MKDKAFSRTIESKNALDFMMEILQTPQEQLKPVVEQALEKVMIDSGADHLFLSLGMIQWHRSKNNKQPLNPTFVHEMIRQTASPLLFHRDDYDRKGNESSIVSMMNVRQTVSWLIVPLGDHAFLSIEFSSKIQNQDEILKSIEWLMIALQSKYVILHLQEKLQENDRTKREFLSNMSHEIRTPLSGIYNAFYLLNTTGLSLEQLDYVNNGMTSVDHLSSIIDDVLDYANIESGATEIKQSLFNLEEEMIRWYQRFKTQADEKKLAMHFDFDYTINYNLMGDLSKIKQMIFHLLDNAIKYTIQGSVELSARCLSSQEESAFIQLTVKDSGIGIPKEDLHRIHDAFVQMDSSKSKHYQGTGLGLSIVSELTELLGGELDVESTLDQGSRFSITIPLKKDERLTYPQIKGMKALRIGNLKSMAFISSMFESMGIECYDLTTINQQRADFIFIDDISSKGNDIKLLKKQYGQPGVMTISLFVSSLNKLKDIDIVLDWPTSRQTLQQKINNLLNHHHKENHTDAYTNAMSGHALVVDDNRLNRIALQSILLKQGIRSTLVESGPKAIELVKHDVFDIIFMDIQMPTMDGLETTRRIRNLGSTYEQIPIIAITANQYFNDYDLMKSTNISDVLFKPIRMEHLSQLLRKHLQKQGGIQIPINLAIFDVIDFDHRFEGSDDIALEVMHTFIDEYPKDLIQIRQSIAAMDAKRIYETTHYFKGSCAYLSGKRVVWLLSQMTTHAKNGNLETMTQMFHVLESEIEELVKLVTIKLESIK